MTKESLISVIVPVYNNQNYLRQSIDSILSQTYKNLEILIVDDGSSDQSGAICDEYAAKDSRIRVFHTANRGASAAKNLALSKASGKFIGFVDSDDYVTPGMYQHLLDLLETHDADVAQIALKETAVINPDAARAATTQATTTQAAITQATVAFESSEQLTLLEGDAILVNYLQGSDFSLQTRLHRRFLFEDFSFDEGRINEDIVAGYLTLGQSRRIVISDAVCYLYRLNRQGITNGPLCQRDFDLVYASERLVSLTNAQTNQEIRQLALARLRRAPFTLLIKMALYGASLELDQQSTVRQLRAQLRRNLSFLLRSTLPANRKVLLLLVCLNYPFTRWLARHWLAQRSSG